MIKSKRRKAAPKLVRQTGHLASNRTGLDVVILACEPGERQTVIAEEGSRRFTVLIDRNGPCNATGAGLTASAALEAVAAMAAGSFVIEPGWPVAQPFFQLGLDLTMKRLRGLASEAAPLPVPRGVDRLRDEESHPAAESTWTPLAAATIGAPMAEWTPAAAPVARFARAAGEPLTSVPAPALPAMPARPVAAMAEAPAIPVVATVTTPVAARPAVAEAQTELPQMPPELVAALDASRPAFVSAANLDAVMAPPPPAPALRGLMSVDDELLASLRPLDPPAPDPRAAGLPGTSRKQGLVKHQATQGLLWVLDVDQPDCYTLDQAWSMASRGTTLWVQDHLRHLGARFGRKLDGVSQDWRESGAAADRATRRRTASRASRG
ncbi:MAG TPA: hypothetical protein VG245_05275 [Candidatus Dormibacteraeota bacterium]|jgi:hypothetical protein|nr:hypothetical protein [Candidatus Dormibacteraeota bacterium]